MTLDRLREELARLGDTAPVARVDPDTWQRAGRARRRDRLVVAGAVLAVALLAGALTWLPDRIDPPVAAGAGDAVPDHVHLPPERMAQRSGDGESWARDDLETDLAIGTAAFGFVMEGGLPVVVDADDGDYHLLDLPDFVGSAFSEYDAPLSLSPDGRRLAYAWVSFAPDPPQNAVSSGVRVVDLQTGTGREIPLPGDRRVLVSGFEWSPSSDWLAWRGNEMNEWTRGSSAVKAPVAGIVGPGTDTSRPLPVLPNNAYVSYAPADNGTVAIVGDSRMLVVDGTSVQRRALQVDDRFTVGATYVDGRLYDVRTADGDRGYSVHLDPSRERLDFPEGGMTGDRVEVLGWIDSRHLVARVTGPGDDEGQAPESELAMIEVGKDPSYRVVGTFDRGVPPISVATDLMTLEQPTVERPEPRWPWSSERWFVTLALAGVAVLLVLRLVFLRQRRRPGRRTHPSDDAPAGGLSRGLSLVGGTVLGAGLSVVWLFTAGQIVGDSTSNEDGSGMMLAGSACLIGVGVVALSARRTRWLGAGLILGAVGALVVLVILLLRIGS
jgi:hypothetical protein